jgi:hypothetical protein
MSTPNITRWIGIGLLGLALYGALIFFSSLNPQPDYNTQLEAWARYVTTNHYVLEHLFLSILGQILAIFGVFALGAYLAMSRAGGMGLVAMVITVLGSALLLVVLGVTTFASPEEGQAILAGMNIDELPDTFAATVQALTGLGYILLGFVGNILLGVAIWRSGTLPRWAGALWAAAHVLLYVSQGYAATIGPPEHAADGAGRGGTSSDKRGMDGLQRPQQSHRPAGGSSGGPAEGALIPA